MPITSTSKVALITGSSQGLGLAIARMYAQRGIGLILTARRAEPLEAVRRELSELTQVVAWRHRRQRDGRRPRRDREGVEIVGDAQREPQHGCY